MRMFQLGNRLWHTDSSFRHVPARASLLYARAVAPIGGHTEFDDLRWRRDMQRATVSESANSCELADAGRLSAA